MKPPAAPKKKRSRLRFIAIFIVIVLLLISLPLLPFLFPATLIRFYLAHSAYQSIPLHIGSAALSPYGVLTLRNIAITDSQESAGKPLASATSVRLTFAWSQITSGRLQTIDVQGADITVRPGRDTPLTLLRLLDSPGNAASPATQTSTAGSGQDSFPFDQLELTGALRFENYEPWQSIPLTHPDQPLPIQLTIKTAGQPATRDISLQLGEDPKSAPGRFNGHIQVTMTADQFRMNATLQAAPEIVIKLADGTLTLRGSPAIELQASASPAARTAQIESLSLRGLNSIDADAAALQWLRTASGASPDDSAAEILDRFKGGAQIAIDELAFQGQLRFENASPFYDGTIHVAGLRIANPPDADSPLAINNFSFKSTIATPLIPTLALSSLRITDGQISTDKLIFGKNEINGISAKLAFNDSKGTLTDVAFSFANGKFDGDGRLSMPTGLDTLNLKFSGLDQAILTQSLYPETFTAEGPISGTLSLLQGANGLAGSIKLSSDRDGRLKIDRQTSAATFAQAAEAAAKAEGTLLPANFKDIVIEQLADYPYQTGEALIEDDPRGLLMQLNYKRVPLRPGDPGFETPVNVAGQTVKANLAFQLGGSISINNSVVNLLRKLLGFRDTLLNPVQPDTTVPKNP